MPTDVEVGRDGHLYVTTLPGGPEGPSLGARGSVYRVDPWHGRVRRVATGFLGATNLALGRHGEIFVSELFGDRISTAHRGGARKLLDVPAPAGLEYRDGRLYVGYDVFGSGKVATVDLGHRGRHHHAASTRRVMRRKRRKPLTNANARAWKHSHRPPGALA